MIKRIAIIPARGGSKRLPRKNILPLAEKPLLAHVILTCLDTQLFDQVIVSSEDQEIIDIAKEYGAQIHNRNLTLASDHATVNEVCESVLSDYGIQDENHYFCMVYATAALITADTIRRSFSLFEKGINYIMGVSNYNYSPVQALTADDCGFLSYQWPEFKGVKSQEYPKLQVCNGSFYWARSSSFVKDKNIYSSGLIGYLMNDNEVCDVDVEGDYLNLKLKYKFSNR